MTWEIYHDLSSITKPSDHEAVLKIFDILLPLIQKPGDNIVTEWKLEKDRGR